MVAAFADNAESTMLSNRTQYLYLTVANK